MPVPSSRQTQYAIWARSDYRTHDKGTAMDKSTDNSQSRVGPCLFENRPRFSPLQTNAYVVILSRIKHGLSQV
jgi:hypothetical protein